MKKILVVESSPMGEKSVSRKLTREIVIGLLREHPGSVVRTRDLSEEPLPHLSLAELAAFGAPPGGDAAARASDEAVAELLDADIVVIGAPMWNFGVPSALKAWIDHVVRAGRTFAYTASGPRGLAGGKKVYVAASSGGVYSEGPGKANEFVESYLRAVFGLIGIDELTVVRAEGLAIPGLKETALERARRQLSKLLPAASA